MIGIAAGSSDIHQILNFSTVSLLLFFTFPFNFLLYGINDYFDQETDAHNPKKKTHEYLLKQTEKKYVVTGVYAVLLVGGVIASHLSTIALAWFVALIFLSIFYSAPPLRFKSHPYIDSYSNILYAIPGYISFSLLTHTLPSLPIVCATACWTAALHTFSAIPDISVDAKAHIQTTAVTLGHKGALLFVGCNWLTAAIVFSLVLGPAGLLTFVYPLIVVVVMNKPVSSVEKIYWKLPLLNASLGFLGFWYLLFR